MLCCLIKERFEMTSEAKNIVEELMTTWAAESDLKIQGLWKVVTPHVWRHAEQGWKCTLSWPAWDLSIITFAIPMDGYDDANAVVNSQGILYDLNAEQNELVITHSPAMRKKVACDLPWYYQPVPVADIVDAFLLGEWTPWWHCRACHHRITGKTKPHEVLQSNKRNKNRMAN